MFHETDCQWHIGLIWSSSQQSLAADGGTDFSLLRNTRCISSTAHTARSEWKQKLSHYFFTPSASNMSRFSKGCITKTKDLLTNHVSPHISWRRWLRRFGFIWCFFNIHGRRRYTHSDGWWNQFVSSAWKIEFKTKKKNNESLKSVLHIYTQYTQYNTSILHSPDETSPWWESPWCQ